MLRDDAVNVNCERTPLSRGAVLFGMVLALVFTFVIGTISLDADPVWGDELISLGHAGALRQHFDPADTWRMVRSLSEAHTPGYFLMLGVWGSVTGWSPVTLRCMSVLIGLLGVAWTYRLGRDTISAHVGVYAAVVMATSAFFTYYLHELRMYSLIATVTAFAVWAYYHAITARTPRWYVWVGVFLSALLALYTHYFSALVLGAISLYHGATGPLQWTGRYRGHAVRRWGLVVVLYALAGLLFLPWIDLSINGVEAVKDPTVEFIDGALPVHMLGKALLERFGNDQLVLALIVFGLAGIALLVRRRAGMIYIAVTTAALFGLLASVNELGSMIPLRRLRYILVLWPLLAVLAGLGFDALRRWRWLPTALLLVWAGVGVNASLGRAVVRDQGGVETVFPLHMLADTLDDETASDDLLVVFGASAQWGAKYMTVTDYYMNALTRTHYYVDEQTGSDMLALLQAEGAMYTRVWVAYLDGETMPALNAYVDTLQTTHELARTLHAARDLRIDLYVLPDGGSMQ